MPTVKNTVGTWTALRAWRAQGITTIDAARRQGQLEGSNIVMTERPNAPAARRQRPEGPVQPQLGGHV